MLAPHAIGHQRFRSLTVRPASAQSDLFDHRVRQGLLRPVLVQQHQRHLHGLPTAQRQPAAGRGSADRDLGKQRVGLDAGFDHQRWCQHLRMPASARLTALALGSVGLGAGAAQAAVAPDGPLMQGSSLLGAQQQREDAGSQIWTLFTTASSPDGTVMSSSPINGYALGPHAAMGCFLFVCNVTPPGACVFLVRGQGREQSLEKTVGDGGAAQVDVASGTECGQGVTQGLWLEVGQAQLPVRPARSRARVFVVRARGPIRRLRHSSLLCALTRGRQNRRTRPRPEPRLCTAGTLPPRGCAARVCRARQASGRGALTPRG